MTITNLTTMISAPQSRRQFLKTSTGLGLSAAGLALLGACGSPATTSSTTTETLETTTIKLGKAHSVCVAPMYLAEDLLKAEGFTDVQYIEPAGGGTLPVQPLASGEINVTMAFSGPLITWIETQNTVLTLAGVHVGCFELFGNGNVHTILDLKGKTVGVTLLGGSDHIFLAVMATYVGMDPAKDINWAVHPRAEGIQLFIDGKIDAVLAFPPDAQELRAKKIGQVVVNSMMDKPWLQYFCCMLAANSDFVKKNPVATKRAVRSILKAADLCALQPERAAKYMVDKGFASNYDYALEAMQDIPYNRWREYDPNDTLRFYALKLREAGMIKSSPDEIIARGTDWRFLNQIKQETKG
jgi:NitT/TauT family transport system substrate-binding protein